MNINGVQNNQSFEGLRKPETQMVEENKNTINSNMPQELLQEENPTLPPNDEKVKKSMKDITEGLNEMVRIFDRKLDFVLHDDSHRMMVKVVDTEKDEVIREIPPEKILDLVARMQDTLSIFVDVRV